MLSLKALVCRNITSVTTIRGISNTRAKMALFEDYKTIPVTLPPELTKDMLLGFTPYKTWLSTLKNSLSLQNKKSHPFHDCPYKLRKIDVQTVDFFGGNRLGFVKFKATISNDNGEHLPGSVFLRGGSVAMMV
jgi:ADP-sugar diphosphatase